jgi:hypothetical protein
MLLALLFYGGALAQEDCEEWQPTADEKATLLPACMNFIDYSIPLSFKNKTRIKGGADVLQADYDADQGVKSTAPSACSVFFKDWVSERFFFVTGDFSVLILNNRSRFNAISISRCARTKRWFVCAPPCVKLLRNSHRWRTAIRKSSILNVSHRSFVAFACILTV